LALALMSVRVLDNEQGPKYTPPSVDPPRVVVLTKPTAM
jgi:hypothetical protein